MILTAESTVLGQKVTMTVEIQGEGAPRGEALSRITGVMFREVERIAQVAGVDVRDQAIDRENAMRLRDLPKDRPHIIVGIGTKDPNAVQVVRGTYEVGGKKLSAPARNEEGRR